MSCKISSFRRIGPNTLPPTAKASGQYINSVLAKLEASRAGDDEAILLNEEGYIADGSGENIFVVKDDNTVEARPVTLGPLDEGLRVIREGLKAEDRVIIDGLQRARVGAKVTPQTAEIKPAGGKS